MADLPVAVRAVRAPAGTVDAPGAPTGAGRDRSGGSAQPPTGPASDRPD
jgi:hypothetical protein